MLSPSAKIRDVTERLIQIIQPIDYYPFLLFHVGMNNTTKKSLKNISRDYEDLGRKAKELGVQVMFSSVLPRE